MAYWVLRAFCIKLLGGTTIFFGELVNKCIVINSREKLELMINLAARSNDNIRRNLVDDGDEISLIFHINDITDADGFMKTTNSCSA